MLTLPLDPTDDRADPAFKDAAGCARWLGQLQFTNLQLAHGALSTQLDELNRYPMRGLERWHILELLRETVSLVQADYAKKLIAKNLPLSEQEFTIFVSIVGLWQQMLTGYQRCLQASVAGDRQLADYAARLCQRCLLYSNLQIFEHLHAGYECSARLWQQLHALHAYSEEQGLQQQEVADGLDGSKRQPSCHTIYIKTLLICYARPAEFTRGQMHLLDRWLTQWSADITVARRCTVSRGDAPPLAVDLDGTQGLQALNQTSPSDNMRYLAMVPLSKLLRVKIILLQQGQSPQQLGLYESSSGVDCIELLNHLHRCWCEELAARRSVAHQAQLCYGLEGIYTYIAKKPFKLPGKDGVVDELARKQIATFGRVLSETDHKSLHDLGYPLELWQVTDESIFGARLLRAGSAGVRLGRDQIIAMHPADASGFILGTTSGVSVTQTGQLSAAVRYLPGVAQAIAIKASGINPGVKDQTAAALLLPAVPALKTPASLLIPRNWFQPGRIVEIIDPDNQKLGVKLGFSVEIGADYERVSFSPV